MESSTVACADARAQFQKFWRSVSRQKTEVRFFVKKMSVHFVEVRPAHLHTAYHRSSFAAGALRPHHNHRSSHTTSKNRICAHGYVKQQHTITGCELLLSITNSALSGFCDRMGLYRALFSGLSANSHRQARGSSYTYPDYGTLPA